MKKFILSIITATLLLTSISALAQTQQNIQGYVQPNYFPYSQPSKTGYNVITSPAKVSGTGATALFNWNTGTFIFGKQTTGTGRATTGSYVYTKLNNLNILCDSTSTYSTNILFYRSSGTKAFKQALSVANATSVATSTLALMADSGTVLIGHKLQANKFQLNDSSGLSAGQMYIQGNTIKIKR